MLKQSLRSRDRRRVTERDVVMAVIVTMRWIAYLLYGALAACLGVSVWHGLKAGEWEMAVITGLIAAVSGGANSAAGFIAGVLSQTKGTPEQIPPATLDGTEDAAAGQR